MNHLAAGQRVPGRGRSFPTTRPLHRTRPSFLQHRRTSALGHVPRVRRLFAFAEYDTHGVSRAVVREREVVRRLRRLVTVQEDERCRIARLDAEVETNLYRILQEALQNVHKHAGAELSDRGREVLHMIAWGHSNKETAARLDLSVKTVEVHKANAMRKLDMKGRTDIVRYPLLQGWLENN